MPLQTSSCQYLLTKEAFKTIKFCQGPKRFILEMVKTAEFSSTFSNLNDCFSLMKVCVNPQTFSLHADGFSGTAGRTSSLTHTGSQFSTKDRDNDSCTCKCAQLASGGKPCLSNGAAHLPPSKAVSL